MEPQTNVWITNVQFEQFQSQSSSLRTIEDVPSKKRTPLRLRTRVSRQEAIYERWPQHTRNTSRTAFQNESAKSKFIGWALFRSFPIRSNIINTFFWQNFEPAHDSCRRTCVKAIEIDRSEKFTDSANSIISEIVLLYLIGYIKKIPQLFLDFHWGVRHSLC